MDEEELDFLRKLSLFFSRKIYCLLALSFCFEFSEFYRGRYSSVTQMNRFLDFALGLFGKKIRVEKSPWFWIGITIVTYQVPASLSA